MYIRISFYLVCSLFILTLAACSASKSTTATLTYSKDVSKIINLSCIGCHNAERPAGGINLTTYENVKEYSVNGKLIPAIQHAEGVESMPRKSPKLEDVYIQTIVNWVATGAAQ